MKVIDLLNKIANGEAPKKIKYCLRIYEYDATQEDYTCFMVDHYEYLLDNISVFSQLNEKVEIIEEDKEIEKLTEYINCGWCGTCEDYKREDLYNSLEKIGNKVNELIRAVNELKKGK